MKSDFLLAITQISAEKHLPSEVVLSAVETALASAYRKDNFATNQNISVKINQSGKVQVWAEKAVVEKVADPITEISLPEALRIDTGVQVGDLLMVESTPSNAGRIAAQTAKQVILQRLHEAEHTAIMEEYAGREGDIVTGLIQRFEQRQIIVDLGRTEAILPVSEQVPGERYRTGQRIKVCILEVAKSVKGPRVVVSRAHPDLLRSLFESEIPEIFNGIVNIESIAREAGARSKVAVSTKQPGLDPVGCCVGLRGIRIQNIVNELNGEKIDVVLWNKDPAVFIANALSPAQIMAVELYKEDGLAAVVVPDRQLSLAIGREGQNVRLAVKLTGWKIDIRSASEAEAEKIRRAEAKAAAGIIEEEIIEEPVVEEAAVITAKLESAPAHAEVLSVPPVPVIPAGAPKPRLRFAEDILAPVQTPVQQPVKAKKGKKKGYQERDGADERGKGRKGRRDLDIVLGDESDEEDAY